MGSEYTSKLSGNEQDAMARAGAASSGDDFHNEQPELDGAGRIFEKLERTVEEVESGKANDGADSGEVLVTESDKGSSTTMSSAQTTDAMHKEFPQNATSVSSDFKNAKVISAFKQAKATRVDFLRTKRGFGLIKLQDPPEVDAVKESIRRLNLQLMNKVAQIDGDYAFQIESICLAYERLIKSCHDFGKDYSARKKLSRKEETWLDLSQKIEKQSEFELGEFKEIKRAFILGHRFVAKSWTDILAEIRTVDNSRYKGPAQGGRSSKVDRLEVDNNVYFVKNQDRIADSEEDASKKGSLKATEFKASQGAQINPGMTVADRNVSSNRVAERLGMGDILAKSITGFRINRGERIQSNYMEGIVGTNVMTLSQLVDSANGLSREENKTLSGKTISFSGKAARQMFELQILDLISGQVDRHGGNIMTFYEISGDIINITGIKGIDNDMSFGNISAEHSFGNKYFALSDFAIGEENDSSKEKVSVPYISRNLYERLMIPGLEEVLKFDQFDLRSHEEIASLIKRFIFVRNKIKDLCKRGLMQIIDDDEELERIYRERMIQLMNDDKLAPSTFSRLITEMGANGGNFLRGFRY